LNDRFERRLPHTILNDPLNLMTENYLYLVLMLVGIQAASVHVRVRCRAGKGRERNVKQDCTRHWKSFGKEEYLDTMQVLDEPELPSSFEGFEHGSPYQGLFVDPVGEFAFCTIEKNACSVWTSFLEKVRTGGLSGDGPAFFVAHQSFQQAGPDKVEGVFRSPSAVRAVMIRDPLARFASGFLDKCYSKNCSNQFCFPRYDPGFEMTGKPITFETAVESLLQKNPEHLDAHFKPQSSHCELSSRLHEYTHIGLMTPNTLSNVATCLIDRAGLSIYNVLHSGGPLWQTLENSSAARLLHTQEKNSVAKAWLHDEDSVLSQLYTKSAAMRVMEYFKKDYELFNLPVPKWVDAAEGGWYDRAPAGCEKPAIAMKEEDAYHNMLAEDDIVLNAAHAGYF
jgi:hypothetical protein